MRRALVLPVAAALLIFMSGTALADPEGPHAAGLTPPGVLALITDDDLFSTTDLSLLLAPPAPLATSPKTQHYGPYTSDSTDSGCNIDPWANETFDRHFTVRPNPDGTITVVEQFKNGSFTTVGSLSPGEQCADSKESGEAVPLATVDSGITGGMHGYFIISSVGQQTSTSSSCDATDPNNPNCDTFTFLHTHFTCVGVNACEVTTFFFHYAAGDQNLVEHEWKNASPDRGGNSGDIASNDPD
jgi:hypothetical protein